MKINILGRDVDRVGLGLNVNKRKEIQRLHCQEDIHLQSKGNIKLYTRSLKKRNFYVEEEDTFIPKQISLFSLERGRIKY